MPLRDFSPRASNLAGFSSASRLRSFGTEPELEPDRGVLGTLLNELKTDVKGAGKVATAPAFSFLEALGAQVPFSFDDLERRDFTGAAAVASMFVGGAVAQGAKGAKAGVGALKAQRFFGTAAARAEVAKFSAGIGFAQRLGITAGSEAAAGAFFGAVKPLEDAESRLEAIVTDTALFAGLGTGFSLVGQGVKASAGATLARVKRQKVAALGAQTLRQTETSNLLGEHAGFRLWNPETLKEATVRRTLSGKVKVLGAGIGRSFDNFGTAFTRASEQGFIVRLGVAKSDLRKEVTALAEAGIDLDPTMLNRIQSGDKLFDVIDEVNLGNYTAVREILGSRADSDKLLTSLELEAIHTNGDLANPIRLDRSMVEDIRKTLTPEGWGELKGFIDPSTGKIANGLDADFLRESIRRGAVSVENLSDGITMRDWISELTINGRNLGDAVLVANSGLDAGFEARFMSTRTLQKIHPEIQPVTAPMFKASAEVDIGGSNVNVHMEKLKNTFSIETMSKAGNLIQENMRPIWSKTAAGAIAAAKATGDEAVVEATREFVDLITRFNLRDIAKGRKGFSNATPAVETSVRRKLAEALGRESESLSEFNVGKTLARLNETSPNLSIFTAEERKVFSALMDSTTFNGFSERENYLGAWRLVGGSGPDKVFDSFRSAQDALVASTDEGLLQLVPEQSVDSAAARLLTGKELQRFKQRELQSFGVSVDAATRERLRKDSILQSFDQVYKVSNPVTFGEISTDPFRTLEFFSLGKEHALGFSELASSEWETLLAASVPANKSELIARLRNKRDLMLGKPTSMERAYKATWERVFPEISAPDMRKVSGAIRRWEGYSKLGGVWSGVVNVFQTPTNTTAKLGLKHTAAGIETIFNSDKLKEFSAYLKKWGIDLEFHTMQTSEGVQSSLDSIGGAASSAIARYKLNGGKSAAGSLMQAAKNIWMFSFNTSESFNRYAAAAGAWSKGKADNLSGQALANFVEEMTRTTQHSYRSSNIPEVLQGPIGSLLGQFKSWFIFEAEFIASLNKEELTRFGTSVVALGGVSAVLAVPGADIIDSAGLLFSDRKLSEALKGIEATTQADPDATALTKAVTRFSAYGAPGLAGVDLSNYLGPGSLWEVTRGLLGPGLSDAKALMEFVGTSAKELQVQGRVQEDTYSRFVRAIVPSQVRRIKTASNILNTGEIRSPYSGKLVYQPERRVRAAFAAAFGAPLTDASSQRAVDDVVNRTSTAYRDVRESYRKQIALAQLSGDAGEARKLQVRAGRAGFSFDASDIQRALRDFSKNADERRRLRTPTDLRQRFLEDFQTIR